MYNFLTFIIVCYYIVPWFWYPPPLALVPVYDSDVVYYLLLLFVSFSVYDNYADQRDIDIFI